MWWRSDIEEYLIINVSEWVSDLFQLYKQTLPEPLTYFLTCLPCYFGKRVGLGTVRKELGFTHPTLKRYPSLQPLKTIFKFICYVNLSVVVFNSKTDLDTRLLQRLLKPVLDKPILNKLHKIFYFGRPTMYLAPLGQHF